ncbi:hypothetical protein, partial [Desulfurella sp.]|uniref:hypothetical protein n=1 Tax=Desulfurella sp. TaxID=1962857 RepID=UPI0025BF59AB
KLFIIEVLAVVLAILFSTVYIYDYNNNNFKPINNVSLNKFSEWYTDSRLKVMISDGILIISSMNNVYGSWPIINTNSINVPLPSSYKYRWDGLFRKDHLRF